MRKVGVVKVEAGDVEVKEFRVRDVVELFEEAQEGGDFGGLIEKYLPRFVNVNRETLMDMTPGELEAVWNKFREVNESFFKLAGTLKVEKLLNELVLAIHADFFGRLAGLRSGATGPESGS